MREFLCFFPLKISEIPIDAVYNCISAICFRNNGANGKELDTTTDLANKMQSNRFRARGSSEIAATRSRIGTMFSIKLMQASA